MRDKREDEGDFANLANMRKVRYCQYYCTLFYLLTASNANHEQIFKKNCCMNKSQFV